MKPIAECFFLDVGQGTANVVLLPGRRGILIDAGPVRRVGVVHRLLRDYVDVLECVVLSHHDLDHIGGWEQIAQDFGHNIRRVCCVPDSYKAVKKRIDITMRLVEEEKLPPPVAAYVKRVGIPETLWQDADSGISLELHYPDLQQGHAAAQANRANRASVIVELNCGAAGSILFPGDADITAWRLLEAFPGRCPFRPVVFAVAHHGGLPSQNPKDIEWLFERAVNPKFGVVSVGSANGEDHPRQEVIRALRARNVAVLCTEVTPKCHAASLETLRPSVLRPLTRFSTSSSIPSFTSSARRSRFVGCAGTVLAQIFEDRITVMRQDKHRQAITALSSPMCVP